MTRWRPRAITTDRGAPHTGGTRNRFVWTSRSRTRRGNYSTRSMSRTLREGQIIRGCRDASRLGSIMRYRSRTRTRNRM